MKTNSWHDPISAIEGFKPEGMKPGATLLILIQNSFWIGKTFACGRKKKRDDRIMRVMGGGDTAQVFLGCLAQKGVRLIKFKKKLSPQKPVERKSRTPKKHWGMGRKRQS